MVRLNGTACQTYTGGLKLAQYTQRLVRACVGGLGQGLGSKLHTSLLAKSTPHSCGLR